MHSQPSLLLHDFQPVSRSNGPGLRAVIWFQGCTLNCPGCFNPSTHSSLGGKPFLVKEVAERILDLRNVIEGVSISGGEPFQQKPALIDFLRIIRTSSTLSTLVFTGYTRRELEEIDPRGEALDNIDLLIAGRYRSSHHSATRLLGSANQKIYYLTDRYDPADIAAVPEAEVWLNPDGSIALSGITPLDWDTGKAG